ncbi:RHS repeat-associated core domain-containing protein [Lentzea sp. NPDC102401]|uniref:RHS repeat-associated core domain-containing protein n=1 Tax=Lentzea sp. NPDC102401 TaxID=3364128 RepID=UPI0037F7BF6C
MLSLFAATALLAGGVVPMVSADAPREWVPSADVNRTAVGGPPPARSAGELGPRTLTCTSFDQPGSLPSYPMERHRISDRIELAVNLSSGNLMVTARDLTLKGTGLDLSVSHVYNSQDWARNSFGNWQLNSGPAVRLVGWNGSMELYGPNGYCVSFTERSDGTFADAPGLGATLEKIEGDKYNLAFRDSKETWTFNADGWLLSQSDRNGHSNSMRYTTDGEIASIVDSQGRVTTFASDETGEVKSITDPSGFTFGGFAYDTDQRLSRFAGRDGKPVSMTYDEDGNLTSITDARTGKYTVTWKNSVVESLTVPIAGGTATTKYDFDLSARKTTVTDANEHSSVHEFDSEGRQTKATDALGHSQSATWTANSDVNSATNALSHSTTYQYDTLNNLIGTSLPTGAKNVVGYTDAQNPHLPTQVTTSSGDQITSEYDSSGNVTKVRSVGFNADVQKFSYRSGFGNLLDSRTDGKGATTKYEYDRVGNLTAVVPPAPAKPTRYGYDSLSRLTSVTDGNGVKIDYGYDQMDRVITIKRGTTTLQANTFDANGNLTGTQTSNATRTLEYDPSNRLTKVTRGGEVVSYTYDKIGNLRTLTTPTGTATYNYDAASRLTSLSDSYGGTTGFGYDDADRRTTTTFPGGAVQTTGYDNSGRWKSISVAKQGNPAVITASYRYTKTDGTDTDKIQSKTIKGVTTDYTYDALGRLTRAGGDYGLDLAANLLSGEGRTYQVNAADQYTKINDTSVVFDGAGNYASTTNPDSSFTFSPTNQVLTGNLGATKVLDFKFDTADQTQPGTITESGTGFQTTHAFTRTAVGVTETVDNGKRSSYTRDPDGLLVGLKDAAGARFGAVTDQQGSVLGLVDSSGNLAAEYSYAPYGAVTATGTAAASNPFRYLGAYQLQRGHYLLGYRVYDSAYARFRSPDPTGQEANAYNYAQGDPINKSDPTGAYGWADFAGDAVGGLFGLAVGVSFGTAISPYVSPVGGAIGGVAAGGCVKETVSNVVTNSINGQTTGLAESAGACAGGAVLGAL